MSLSVSWNHSRQTLDDLVTALQRVLPDTQLHHTFRKPKTTPAQAETPPSHRPVYVNTNEKVVPLEDILVKRMVPRIAAVPKTSRSLAFEWDKEDSQWSILESVYSWDSYHGDNDAPLMWGGSYE